MLSLTFIATLVASVGCLDNGLARTPPMGWLSWERFQCYTACDEDPDNCIAERLIKTIADAMVYNGFRDAGYEYVVIDDCWPASQRDFQGRLQGDLHRFPGGMKSLASYVHSKELKFGLYEDVGHHTCAGAPGSQGFIDLDARTFADWGVDYLKFDGCNAEGYYYRIGYPEMSQALNRTGRHILYSCEWPLYERSKGIEPNYKEVAKYCNSWRVYGDIWDAWESITSIIYWYGDNPGNFTQVAGPGQWNDGDMLVIGNYGLSPDQEKVQMAMWCMFASSLLISADVRSMRRESLELLQHKGLIAINQDPQGTPAIRVAHMDEQHLQIWRRSLSGNRYAIAFLNIRNYGYPVMMTYNLTLLGHQGQIYDINDVMNGRHLARLTSIQNVTTFVNPSGVNLVMVTPVPYANSPPLVNFIK